MHSGHVVQQRGCHADTEDQIATVETSQLYADVRLPSVVFWELKSTTSQNSSSSSLLLLVIVSLSSSSSNRDNSSQQITIPIVGKMKRNDTEIQVVKETTFILTKTMVEFVVAKRINLGCQFVR